MRKTALDRTLSVPNSTPLEPATLMSDLLPNAPLGKDVAYPDTYDPGLLFALPRDTNRQALSIPASWHGADIWNAYEISWLTARGKPVVAVGQFTFPHDSPNLVESKSLKLYLNSLNQERVASPDTVQQRISADLSGAAGAPVDVHLTSVRDHRSDQYAHLPGTCIDDLDIAITTYQPDPSLLRCAPNGKTITEVLTSELLKSNCPVTGQPDWASVQISYTGPEIDRGSLLEYIVSLRQHSEFHEHCIEKMYCDVWRTCSPTALTVYARYTRRGGLDINPWRSSHPISVSNIRTVRQ